MSIIPAYPSQLSTESQLPDFTALLSGTVTASTAAVYQNDARAYADWARGQGLDPMHPASFGAWRAHLVTATSYSPRTINRMLSAVRKLMREAATQGIIPKAMADSFAGIGGVKVSAMVGRTKRNARVRISPAQMRAIVNAPDTTTLKGLRDRAFLLVLATAGLRVSEACGLTVDALEERPDGQGVSVLGKNRSERHFAPMSREAWNAVQAWLKARPVASDFIFISAGGRGGRWGDNDKPLSKVAAWKMVQAYAAQVGLRGIKPHDFRRFVLSDVAGNVTEGLF